MTTLNTTTEEVEALRAAVRACRKLLYYALARGAEFLAEEANESVNAAPYVSRAIVEHNIREILKAVERCDAAIALRPPAEPKIFERRELYTKPELPLGKWSAHGASAQASSAGESGGT